jgi:hypothetical protein
MSGHYPCGRAAVSSTLMEFNMSEPSDPNGAVPINRVYVFPADAIQDVADPSADILNEVRRSIGALREETKKSILFFEHLRMLYDQDPKATLAIQVCLNMLNEELRSLSSSNREDREPDSGYNIGSEEIVISY